ncbi:MAG: hypothetical protein Q4B70_00940 [Lachnospiraceae bacterium]|nr:hypothetical protein [Lachnospiraceae bacterium]
MEDKKRPQDKWDEKAGIAAKTYKIEKKTADEFKALCKELNIGQGPTITKLMKDFIEQHK